MGTLIKALALNNEVRVYIVKNEDIMNEAITRHDLWPTAASVLGKTITVCNMMSSMLKGDEAITIKINGNGPIGNVVVDGYANGNVRGYVSNPHINFINSKGGFSDVTAIGNDGYIDVIKDLKMKDLFTSSILLTGDLAKDFTYYFYESEQTRSVVNLGITINVNNLCTVSGGMIIQLLPNASEESISFIENKLKGLESMSTLLSKYTLKDILNIIFDDIEIVEESNVKFYCPCSKEGFTRSLLTLGEKDLIDIAANQETIEAVCHYCENKYKYDKQEILDLLEIVKRR